MDYSAARYSARLWGVFHAPSKNWCVFGTRRMCERRAKQLNAAP